MSPFIDTMRVHFDEIVADRENRHTWDEIATRYWRREPRPCRRTLLRLLQQVQGERDTTANA